MNLINDLRELAEDLHVNGYNRYSAVMSKAADELAKWEAVFGHLGDTPDECGNAIIAARDELEERCATLTDALRQAVRQNSHDMLITAEELRSCEAALEETKMNDRELLELAAKAAGFGAQNPPDNPHCWTESEYPKGSGQHGALWNYVGYSDTAELWNPLSDDGDALRLAVKLGIELAFTRNKIGAGRHSAAFYLTWVNEDRKVEDPCAATRRVIVRAAAEIGRNMK